LELERCEFDIESIEVLPASLDVGNPEMREVNFDIKVGNLKERYINPPLNTFLYDTIINGFGRTAQGDETIFIGSSNQKSVILGDESYAKVDYRAQVNHQSARPVNISETASSLKNSIPAWANSSYKSFDEVNPTDPATWAGNALTLGKAFVENIVEGAIDKASVVKIPGLGISFNEALTAIQSKNVLSLFGAARRAFGQGVEGTLPSQQLDENFVDTQFKEFLESLVLSEATDEETIELQETANIILSDKGVWEKIKDLSKATDLLSAELNEINIENKITNSNSLRTSYNQEYVPQPLQDGLIYEGIPSSVSTQNDLSSETGIIPQPQSGIASESELSKESGIIPQPLPGEATDNDMDLKEGTTTGLGSTDGNINTDLTTPSPSSSLGNNAGSALDQPSDGLGQSAKGGLATANPGENLGSKAESGGLETSVPGQNLGSDAGNPLPQPGDGLGEFANGRLETIAPSKDLGSAISDNLGTVKPSENLGSNAGTKLPQPGEGLGEVIEGSKIDIPKPGEATDGDPIIGKGPTTSDIKSEATNDKNIKG
jgi:hypothetical protein